MRINKAGLDLYGMTIEDYLYWCRETNRAYYKQETKKKFFELLRNNLITRDPKTFEIVEVSVNEINEN